MRPPFASGLAMAAIVAACAGPDFAQIGDADDPGTMATSEMPPEGTTRPADPNATTATTTPCTLADQACVPWFVAGMAPPGLESVGVCAVPP